MARNNSVHVTRKRPSSRSLATGLGAVLLVGGLVAGTASVAGAATPPRTAVSGTVSYTDRAGHTHGARDITVQIRDADGSADGALLSTVATDATGHYTGTVAAVRADGSTPTRLEIRAIATASDAGFTIHAAGGTTPYQVDSAATAPTGAATTVNLTADNTSTAGKAFDIADALTTADAYTRRINGGSLFPTLNVEFPGTGTGSFYSPSSSPPTMDIHDSTGPDSDAFDWDVMLHEYGHFVSDKLGFINNVGGTHFFGVNDSTALGKTVGVELAWNEGFATFFGIMAQDVENVSALGIPTAGDAVYNDLQDATHVTVDFDLASAGSTTDRGDPQSVGEDDEGSVARTLWHFYKDPELAIPDTAIIAALHSSGAKTLSDAVAALLPVAHAATFDDADTTDAAAEQHSEDFACVLTDQNVAPKITAPSDGDQAKADSPPTITWNADGAGPSNPLNSFVVEFWSPNYDKLMFSSPAQTGTSYTPSATDWKTIVGGQDKNGKYPAQLNVVVRGSSTTALATGPYKSCPISLKVKHVDLVFAIDTTGSMGPYIDSVVASTQNVVDTLSTDGTDYRIAVVDYKDVDSTDPGCPADPYAARTDLPFSNVAADIHTSLAGLTGDVGGGCDIPEDVYSGVEQGLGMAWRPGATKAVIQLGDAAGHDPEAHSGYTLAKVAADAAAVDPAVVFSILIGDDPDAHAFDQALATATGGQTIDATADPSQAGPAIVAAVHAIDDLPSPDAGGPYTGVVGSPVTFSAAGSVAPAGTITRYEWDFTDSGTFTTVPDTTTTHTYTAPYSGPVTLRITDSTGHTATATAQVTVVGGAPTGVSVDQTVTGTEQKSAPITSPALTTTSGGELVLALVSADGPQQQQQRVTSVTGGGLTWTRVARVSTITDAGAAEVWQAHATGPLTGVTVTAALRYARWDGSITVMTFRGAADTVGVVGMNGMAHGAPSVTLKTSTAGALIVGAGHDWSNARTQVPLSGQQIVTQTLDTKAKDTYWVQRTGPVPAAGTTVTFGDSAPRADRWELAAVEVRPAV